MYTSISQRLKILTNSGRTVFTLGDFRSFWGEEDRRKVVITARRMAKSKILLKLGKGYYALSNDYNRFELANIIISPSYISLHSALIHWGVAFQKEDVVYSIALLNYEKKLDGMIYKYHAMKKELLFDVRGIRSKNDISIASPERAVLDSFYFGFLVNLDNAEVLSKSELENLSLLYPRSVQKRAMELCEKL